MQKTCSRHAGGIGRMVRKSSMLNRKEDRQRVGGTNMPGGTVEVMSEGTWEGRTGQGRWVKKAGRNWAGMSCKQDLQAGHAGMTCRQDMQARHAGKTWRHAM